MTDVRIEPTSAARIEGFRAVVGVVARERRFLASTMEFPEAKAHEFVERILAGDGAQFLAIHQDRVVGWCDVIRGQHEGFYHSGTLGMGLVTRFRGMGLGSRLLEQTVSAAHAIGISRIELEVFESNQSAVGLYRKYGFELEGKKLGARVLDGVTDNIICMAKIS